MAISTAEVRLKGIEDAGKAWRVTFSWIALDQGWLSATVDVAKTVDDENLIRVARAKFHARLKTLISETETWTLDTDVWEGLEGQEKS